MKTADKSFSSKAMKVLLSIALVIGLAPAISPAKAYAAATDQITFTYDKAGTATAVTIEQGTSSALIDVYNWDTTAHTLTLFANVTDLAVASGVTASTITPYGTKDITVSAVDKEALNSAAAAALTLDGGKGSLTFNSAKNTEPTAKSAAKAANALEIKGKVSATTALVTEATTTAIEAAGVTVAKDAVVSGNVDSGAEPAAINGTLTGSVTSTGAVTVAGTGSLTGNISGAAVAVNGKATGNIVAATTVSVASGATLTGNIAAASAAITVNGAVSGDVKGSDAVNVASTAAGKDASVASISEAATVTVGSDRSASATTLGNAHVGTIAGATGAITLKNYAQVDKVTVADAQTLTVSENGKATAIALGAGSSVDNSAGENALNATLADGSAITIAAGGKYSDATFTLTLDQKALDALVYTGAALTTAIKAAVTVVPTGSGTATNVDWKFIKAGNAIVDPLEAGTYTATATGKTDLQGVQSFDFTIAQLDASELVIADIAGQPFTESPCLPKPTITTAGGGTVDPANYTLVYSNNTNESVNGASVAINWVAAGSIKGAAVTKTFSIVRDASKYFGNATVNTVCISGGSPVTSAEYTGQPILPAVKSFIVPFDNTELATASASIEYYTSVALTPATKVDALVNPGKYYLKIFPSAAGAKAGYTGFKVVEFSVMTGDLNEWTAASIAGLSDVTYSGTVLENFGKDLKITNTIDASITATIKADKYELTLNPNTATVGTHRVAGLTSADTTYVGTMPDANIGGTKTFNIKALDLSKVSANDVKIAKAYDAATNKFTEIDPVVYTGSAQGAAAATDAKLFVKVNGAWAAIPVADYDLIVDPDGAGTEQKKTDAGSYTLRVKGKTNSSADNVIGAIDLANGFTIEKADMKSVTAIAAKAIGESLTPGFNGKSLALTDATLTGAAATPVFGTDYIIEYYPVLAAGEAATPVAAPTDAGTYNMYVKALDTAKNYKGTNKGSASYATPNKLVIAKLTVNTTSVDSTLKGFYPYAGGAKVNPTDYVLSVASSKVEIPRTEVYYTYSGTYNVGDTVTGTMTVKKDSVNFVADATNLTKTFAIANKNDIRSCTATVEGSPYAYAQVDNAGTVAAKTYDVTDKIVVKDSDGKTLVKGTDYTIDTANVKKSALGDYSIAITGINAYNGGAANTMSATWSIVAADMATASVAGAKDIPVAFESGPAVTDQIATVKNSLSVKDASGLVITNTGGNVFNYEFQKMDADGAWQVASKVDNAGTYQVRATAKSAQAFAGSTPWVSFKVTPLDITNAGFTKIKTATFTGAALAVTGITSLDGTPFANVATTDWEIRYYTDAPCLNPIKDAAGKFVAPTNVGMYYYKIIGKANCTGTSFLTGTYTITPLAVAGSNFVAPTTTYFGSNWDGAAKLALSSTFTGTHRDLAGVSLVKDVDYTVTYKNAAGKDVATPKDAGVYTATLKAKAGSNYTVSGTVDATISVLVITAANFHADPIKAQLFTGKPIEPPLTNVTVTGTNPEGAEVTLHPAVKSDYTLAYPNNTAAADAAVINASGLGNYGGTGVKVATYKIANANDVALADVTPIADQAWTGAQIKPVVSVSMNGKTLLPGSDYYVSYGTNTVAGKGTITIVGAGIYAGTQDVTFNIIEKATSTRLEGDTALDTMAAIQKDAFAANSCDTVIVTTQAGYYDALAAAGLAGALKGNENVPVLITDKATLSAQTASTISYVGATNIIVVGGLASVSDDVYAQLKALSGVTSIKRLSGDNAVETAVVANAEAQKLGSVSDTAILATSAHFADALAAAPYAYAKGAPIYLASADGSMTPEVAAALKSFKNVKIVGGTLSVTEATEAALTAQGNTVARWSGDDAYQTSADIATKAVADGTLSFDTVSIATGKTYYDALCASAAAGSKKSVVVLVDEGTSGSFALANVIAKNKDAIHTVNFLGGKASVTLETEKAVMAALA